MAEKDLQNEKENRKDVSGLPYGLARAGQIGFNIAIPILIAILVGRYLDNRFFPNHHIFILIFPLFGGIFSMWYVYKTTMAEINNEISAIDKKEGKKR